MWLPHPSSVWLWVMKVFRCAYYVVSQFSCRLLWSNKTSEQSWYVAAIAAWHTSEKCQRSGADKVGVNSWLTQSPFLKFHLCVLSLSLPCSLCCFLIDFSILNSLSFSSIHCESTKPFLLYKRQILNKMYHSCESSASFVDVLAVKKQSEVCTLPA